MGSCFFSKITKNVLVKAAAAACIVVGMAFGQTAIDGSSLTWKLENGTLTISGTGAMPDFAWDETPWFNDRSSITSAVIEDGVTSIGTNAFWNCTGLTGTLTIPNSVTSIGQNAFWNCTGLTGTLTIPNSVTSIGISAFGNCSKLTSVTIGNSVTSIGDGAFQFCSGLIGMLTIPNSVTSIGSSAFTSCEKLTSVTIGNSVTSIGDWAFVVCTGLTEVNIGNSVTSIGSSAFASCEKLTSVTISASVTSIGNSAFASCTGLKQIINRREAPQPIDGGVFQSVPAANVKLFVPAGAVGTGEFGKYTGTYGWSSFSAKTFAIPFTLDDITIAVGEEIDEATFDDAAGYEGEKVITWSSGSPAVVIENGKITKGAGNTVRITATLDGGYFSDVLIAKVIKGEVRKPEATATEFVYDGNVKSAGIAENANYTITDAKATNAGTYTAHVDLKDKDNYEWEDGSNANLPLHWTIARAKLTKPAVTNTALVYDGNVKSAGIAENAGYTITNGTATNAGQHIATVALDANHEWTDGSNANLPLTWTIAKAAGASVALVSASKTHNSITITAVVAASGQVVNYAINTANTAPTDATAWKTDLTFAGLSANTDYYIFARAIENANYLAGAISAPLSVKTDVAQNNNQYPIREIQKSDGRTGIRLSKNVVSDKAEFEVILPSDKVLEVKVAIYDNTGNIVFEKTERGANVSWNLTNIAGRNVANGTYLIIAEAKGINGNYAYSAKVGVKK